MARNKSYSFLSETELENFRIYKCQIRKIPRLDLKEEIKLGEEMIHGDEKAREKLINSNLHLVIPVAKYYATPKIPVLDLISEGNSGLTHAANIYSGKCKFSTFANWWIKNAILKALSQTYSSIRQSFGLNEKMTKMKKYLDWDYSIKQVAEIFHFSELQIEELFGMRNEQYLQDPSDFGDKSTSPFDTLEDSSQNVAEQFFQGLERETIMHHFGESLDKKDLEILKMRHGFYFDMEYFLEDIGNFVGDISGERVRQRYNRAVKKVRENPHLKEIVQSGVTK